MLLYFDHSLSMVALMHKIGCAYKYIQVVSVAVYIPSRFSLFELCAYEETEKTKVEIYSHVASSKCMCICINTSCYHT